MQIGYFPASKSVVHLLVDAISSLFLDQCLHYSRFQVTFQSPVPKFVLNIPNYITKFGILCGICKAKFACWWMKYRSTELKYWSTEAKYWSAEMNSFSRQGKALPVEVRNIIVGKWLHKEGIASIANIIQYLVRFFSTLVQYFSTLVGYFST